MNYYILEDAEDRQNEGEIAQRWEGFDYVDGENGNVRKPLVPSPDAIGRYTIPIILGVRGHARIYNPESVVETDLPSTVEPYSPVFRFQQTPGVVVSGLPPCPLSDEELVNMRTNPERPMTWAEVRQELIKRGISNQRGQLFGLDTIRQWTYEAARRLGVELPNYKAFLHLRCAAGFHLTSGPNRKPPRLSAEAGR